MFTSPNLSHLMAQTTEIPKIQEQPNALFCHAAEENIVLPLRPPTTPTVRASAGAGVAS